MLEAYQRRAEQMLSERGDEIVNADYLTLRQEKYDLFPRHFSFVLKAAEEIRKDPDALMYVYFLRAILEDRENVKEALKEVEVKVGWPYDMACVFAAAECTEEIIEKLAQRGVPQDIISATLQYLDGAMAPHIARYGTCGIAFSTFRWQQLYIDGGRLNIGRFNFDASPVSKIKGTLYRNAAGDITALADGVTITSSGRILATQSTEDAQNHIEATIEETDTAFIGYPMKDGLYATQKVTLSKKEWSPALSPSDGVIDVHIPASRDFSREIRDASYKRAWEVMNKAYPEYHFKAFICSSWMMDPQLSLFLKPESNLLDFQSDYYLLASNSGDGGIRGFIFSCPSDTKIEDLPEDTSLRRAVKAHLLSGKHIFSTAGVFFPDRF